MSVFRKLMKHEKFQPLRFVFIGGLATLVHILVAAILIFSFPLLHVYLINITAFLFAFMFSFLGHQYITFQKEGSIVKFLGMSLLGFLLNNIILTLGLLFSLPDFYALVIATMCVPLLTYVVSKNLIFKGSANG
ncbi:GtrA family protein [Halomonas malpeensis]|uniref:GtrA family protein n=3 Tax=Vreelandella malpeensis TaxID=1172368 RepID=A0ABS8DTK0_9GAMM|nr:GtrA family protein [Halomonas malpeensis]